jgi:hypothetical protein
MKLFFTIVAIAAAGFACGGPMPSFGADGGGGSGSPGNSRPAVVILSPEDHHEFDFDDEDDEHHGDDRFELEIEVENADLAEPGQCRGRGNCGHLVLLIDGNACGNPNASSSSHGFEGHFGKCVKVSGQHQIVVELVDDAGNVLASSAPITVNVVLRGHHDEDEDGGEHDGGDDHGGDH